MKREDRIIRKRMQKACEKPDVPFEEFCAMHGIDLTPPPAPAQPPRRRVRWSVVWASLSLAVVLALGIWLPTFCLGNGKPPVVGETPTPPITDIETPAQKDFYDKDVSFVLIDYEELCLDEKCFFLDRNNIEVMSVIRKIIPKDDVEITLGYSVSEIIYGFISEEVLYAYNIQYFVRCYDGYITSATNLFQNFALTAEKGGTTYEYKIVQSVNGNVAFIQFTKGTYEYYLTVTRFGELTEIDEDSIRMLIAHAL